MSRIETTVSAVNEFSQKLSSSYVNLYQEAENIGKQVTEMQQRTEQAEESVTNQLHQANRIQDDAQAKVDHYNELREMAAAEVRSAEAEIDYIYAHPIPVTHTDSDGNSYTTYEIDYAALAAAERRRDLAQVEYDKYNALYQQATMVANEVATVAANLANLQQAIRTVKNFIQEQLFYINQRTQNIQTEAVHNLQSMQAINSHLSDYLSCKRFYRPERPV